MTSAIFSCKGTLSFGEGRGEEKTYCFKNHVFNLLPCKIKKNQKKGLKKFVEVDLVATFAPAMKQTFFNKLTSTTD